MYFHFRLPALQSRIYLGNLALNDSNVKFGPQILTRSVFNWQVLKNSAIFTPAPRVPADDAESRVYWLLPDVWEA